MREIVAGLELIRQEMRDGTFVYRIDREDIHLNIEGALRDRIGSVAGKLHTGRSRNDQVALDMHLYVKRAANQLETLLISVMQALTSLATEHVNTLLPGYTHTQRAQPVVLAHHLLAYVEMYRRDLDRVEDAYRRSDVMPLGAGALAGTTFPIDRNAVARELGFAACTRNSLDAVADRDFVIELLSACSLIMMHSSRLAEELVWWSSSEFGFLQLDDAFATGSSMMPQKKNPDSAELIRGKTGRVYGHLVSMLTMMKGLPLTYNKDLQEDKEPLFDTVDTVSASLSVLGGVLSTLHINVLAMSNATRVGFSTATDMADHLVRRGLPFRDAHEVVGKMVAYCISEKKELADLTLEEFQGFSPLLDRAVYQVIDVDSAVAARAVPGGTAPTQVRQALQEVEEYLKTRGALLRDDTWARRSGR